MYPRLFQGVHDYTDCQDIGCSQDSLEAATDTFAANPFSFEQDFFCSVFSISFLVFLHQFIDVYSASLTYGNGPGCFYTSYGRYR